MEKIKDILKNLPHEPGVYLYSDKNDLIIYVGKAKDLSKRVRQYFRKDIGDEKTIRLVSEIAQVSIIPTASEFDALLLEAKLIRRHMPKYNVISRDDKSPLYVVLTFSEALPRLLLIRRGDMGLFAQNKQNAVYGPFQSGFTLKSILKQIRFIVPYCTQKERRGKPCFYTHLGLCDPCPANIVHMEGEQKTTATKAYRHNLFRIKMLFDGKISWLARQYEKEMRTYAQNQQFEAAQKIKERLLHLRALASFRYDPQVFLERPVSDLFEEELSELFGILTRIHPDIQTLSRIECFDISNLFGQHATASMVVLINGKPEKSQYRRFKIRTVSGISDVAMMREVLSRRFHHPEWGEAGFILIDGGKPQVAAAREVFTSHGITVPFGGLAKREEEIILPKKNGGYITLRLPLPGKAIKVVQRIRDEAHRFAITYHRHLRGKAFLEN